MAGKKKKGSKLKNALKSATPGHKLAVAVGKSNDSARKATRLRHIKDAKELQAMTALDREHDKRIQLQSADDIISNHEVCEPSRAELGRPAYLYHAHDMKRKHLLQRNCKLKAALRHLS